jgi:hypothetical protein
VRGNTGDAAPPRLTTSEAFEPMRSNVRERSQQWRTETTRGRTKVFGLGATYKRKARAVPRPPAPSPTPEPGATCRRKEPAGTTNSPRSRSNGRRSPNLPEALEVEAARLAGTMRVRRRTLTGWSRGATLLFLYDPRVLTHTARTPRNRKGFHTQGRVTPLPFTTPPARRTRPESSPLRLVAHATCIC